MKITLTMKERLDIVTGCDSVEESITVKDTEGASFPSPALLHACGVALSASGMGHPRFELHLVDGYPGEMVALFECLEAFCHSRKGANR